MIIHVISSENRWSVMGIKGFFNVKGEPSWHISDGIFPVSPVGILQVFNHISNLDKHWRWFNHHLFKRVFVASTKQKSTFWFCQIDQVICISIEFFASKTWIVWGLRWVSTIRFGRRAAREIFGPLDCEELGNPSTCHWCVSLCFENIGLSTHKNV